MKCKHLLIFLIIPFLLSVSFVHAAITDIQLDNTTVNENTPSGTSIGTLTTTGGNAPYTYNLTNGTGDNDNAYFTIDGDQLKLNFTPDYESPIDTGDTAGNNTYAVRIRSTDTMQATGMRESVDYSSAYNNYGGFFNAGNYPNIGAFAALKSDGSITVWGNSTYGGSGAPTGVGYTKIYSTRSAFAALKSDGSITAWGDSVNGGTGAPTGTGYTKIHSTAYAFAALKSDGSITAWGDSVNGGSAPNGTGYTKIYSTSFAFAALKLDGSITVWGNSEHGGTGAPTGTGYTKIYSTRSAFAALKSDGSITAWGNSLKGGTGAPTGTGYTKIYATNSAFAALKSDGSITAWGDSNYGGSGAPTGTGYTKIYSNSYAFAALKSDGSITAWGDSVNGGTGAPTGTGYTKIHSSSSAFAALKSDGSITAWGDSNYGGTGAPTGTGYTKIYSTGSAFAALNSDGSIAAWGNSAYGGSGAPTGTGYTKIYSTSYAFVALKSDGSITAWGDSVNGGTAPTGTGYMIPYGDTSEQYEKSFIITVNNDVIDDIINPTVTTQLPPIITVATATGTGTITNTGNENPQRFIQWGTTPNAYTHSCAAGSGGTGNYSCTLTNLQPNTTYYVRAYATNSAGTSYGEERTFTTLSDNYIIPDPDTIKIQNAVSEGYITVNNGTITDTNQVTTNANVTIQNTIFSALFPTNTTITEHINQNFNFQNFTAQNVTNTVKQDQPTSKAAVKIGVPNEKLNFSQDITLQIFVGQVYNNLQLEVLYQNANETDWYHHTYCTITNGYCTFQTNHATIYTVNGQHSVTGSLPMNLNVQVQETLSMDCFDPSDSNTTVSLGTTANPGMITAGTPAVGQSRCTVTTNADQGYYLTITNSNPANATLTHTDPNTGTIYEIQDTTQWNETVKTTTNWTAPTTKGLGFSIITFPEADTTHNEFDGVWNTTNQCPEGISADTNEYAGIPTTPQTISAVTSYQQTATTTNICYKVDVPPSQPSGQYSGQVMFTATSDASGYYQ